MSSVFDTITISSLNDDVIALQIDLSHLLRALKSTENASSITVRLMKKNDLPTLSFEISLSDVSKTLQDVPVSLQSMKRLEEVCEPDLPEPQVFQQLYDHMSSRITLPAP
jgi:HUS1 checkpoint protein